MRHRLPSGAHGLFDRHPRLERAVREIIQDRIGHAAKNVDPVRAIVRRRRAILFEGGIRAGAEDRQARGAGDGEEIPTVHDDLGPNDTAEYGEWLIAARSVPTSRTSMLRRSVA